MTTKVHAASTDEHTAVALSLTSGERHDLIGFEAVYTQAQEAGTLTRLTERQQRRIFRDAFAPLGGFSFCLAIWLTLPLPAKLIGGLWLSLGILYYILVRRVGRAGASDCRVERT